MLKLLLWVATLSLSQHLLRDKEGEREEEHRCSQHSPSLPVIPGCAQDRLPQLQPHPWPAGISHPPIPGLPPPGAPGNNSGTWGLHGARLTRRKGLATDARATLLCFSLLPCATEQTCALRMGPVVRRLLSQSHLISDSFPSHVPR